MPSILSLPSVKDVGSGFPPVGMPGGTEVVGVDVATGEGVAGVTVVAGVALFTVVLASELGDVFAADGAALVAFTAAGVFLPLDGVGWVAASEKTAALIPERLLQLKKINKAPSAKTEITINLAVFFIIGLLKPQSDLMSIFFAERQQV